MATSDASFKSYTERKQHVLSLCYSATKRNRLFGLSFMHVIWCTFSGIMMKDILLMFVFEVLLSSISRIAMWCPTYIHTRQAQV